MTTRLNDNKDKIFASAKALNLPPKKKTPKGLVTKRPPKDWAAIRRKMRRKKTVTLPKYYWQDVECLLRHSAHKLEYDDRLCTAELANELADVIVMQADVWRTTPAALRKLGITFSVADFLDKAETAVST